MHNRLHAKSRCMVMLQMSTRAWLTIVIRRVTFLPVCSDGSLISFLKLSGAESIRKMTSLLRSWNCWVFDRAIYRLSVVVSARSDYLRSCFFYEIFLSLSSIDTPVAHFFWRRECFFIGSFNVIGSGSDCASVVCKSCNFGDKDALSDLLLLSWWEVVILRVIIAVLFMEIKFQDRGQKSTWD